MTTTTEFQLVDINKLVPYANNARTHNKEQILKLRSSLREFGFVNPVIIDREYNVLAGHGRIMAAKEEGIAEVPCVYADHLTEAQKKADGIGCRLGRRTAVCRNAGVAGTRLRPFHDRI